MRAATVHTLAVAVALADAAAGQPSSPLAKTTTKASCSVDRAIFDVMFMQASTAFWSGFVCSDGTFEVSAYDLRKSGRLSADGLAELRRLLATLPVEKPIYSFGDHTPDLFELHVRTNVGRRRLYNVFLEAERSPTVLAIFAAAQILRDTFESKWAQQFALPTPSPSPTPP